MTKKLEIYKCEVCGNIVEMLHASTGQLKCCGQFMTLFKEKTEDQGMEKHVPVIEKTETGVKIKVGDIPHPMEGNHYIEWIELITDGKIYREFLSSGETPEAEFEIKAENIRARSYCNVHGVWNS